eukprot:TRINITY_DN349_c0_g1_i2.p1 TRINITY_DN349_c0_g1~~TRINITY_DN349_c0_g1_i2.p1  ORF type:complete len:345 (+),score=97.99 TRINITY_DN349_c0_g1_i2:138-1037(+)
MHPQQMGMHPQQIMGMNQQPQYGMGMNQQPQYGSMGGMPPQQMHSMGGMAPQQMHSMGGMPPQQIHSMGGMPPQQVHSGQPVASPGRAPVIATKHILLPVSVSSHHVDNSHDVLYDFEITIDEYFPDGSKAQHKHKFSQSFSELKKIHEIVRHGGLVKDDKLHFPSSNIFERRESEKKVAERVSEFKVYFDQVFKSKKTAKDRTFLTAIKCDASFEKYLARVADYSAMLKKESKKKQKKLDKGAKKADKDLAKEHKKLDKHHKKEEKVREEQYNQAVKQQVYREVHGVQPGYAGQPGYM